MKYNGVELEPITEIQAFEEPREMLVWDEEADVPEIKTVLAIMTKSRGDYNVFNPFKNYKYCAEIPQPTKRDMNNLEVMEYLHCLQLYLNENSSVILASQFDEDIKEFKQLKFGLIVVVSKDQESGKIEYYHHSNQSLVVSNKFGILKNGKVTEFKLPQVEV